MNEQYQKYNNGKCFQCNKEASKERHAKRRYDVLARYSNGEPECACCGIKYIEFLVLDHIGGTGADHRREMVKTGKKLGGTLIYSWVKKMGYPPGFRVLCFNCNWAYRLGPVCPHHRNPATAVEVKDKVCCASAMAAKLKVMGYPRPV